jgi:hypothetical protein
VCEVKSASILLLCLTALPSLTLAEGNLIVTPIEILESQPECNAKDQTAYQIVFDAQDITARIGDPEAAQPNVCTIVTRKGGQATEILIPCPEPEVNVSAISAPPDAVTTVEFSGSIVGCRSFAEHSILSVDWQLSGQTPTGVISASGDLTSQHLRVFFDSPALQVPSEDGDAVSKQGVWAIALEALPMQGAASGDEASALTTYVGLSETRLMWGFCFQEDDELRTCGSRSADGMALSSLAGSKLLNDIIRYVHEGKRP